jgi:hypothetical protein
VREILMSFPTNASGRRRWPDFIMLKTDIGTLSQAKWTACEIRDIATGAGLDSKDDPQLDEFCGRPSLSAQVH